MQFEGTGAQILVECLHCAGIDTVFGLPGDTGVTFYDALYAAHDRVRHVLARDERSAAIMADVYARCTNRVGVVEASSGGGTTYVVGGLGEPYASSVPLLVITSDIHRGSRGTGALTEIDQTRLFSAVTKWAATASSAAEIPALVSAALDAATSGRPGPVSLILPEDVLDERARVTIADAERPVRVPRERPAADEALVVQAAEALARAARPAIVAGSGVHLSGAWDELAALAEAFGLPVATTIHGKGTIAETSPWSLGVVGANGARDYANAYLAGADVVLFVGTRANSTDTNGYTCPPRQGTTIIGVDVDPACAGRNYPGSLRLVGDAATVLAQLRDALPAPNAERRRQREAWVAEARHAWEVSAPGIATASTANATGETSAADATGETSAADATGETSAADATGGAALHPAAVVRAIMDMDIAGRGALVVADPGTPTPYMAAYWETSVAARTVIVPRGHGPMGYAIPGAIGAAIAFPGRTVIGLTGDGSFAMSCGELETACRLRLPIIYVQFTNGSFGWIKMLQHLYLDDRYFGVDLGPADAAGVARGFGLHAAQVGTLDEFRHALGASLAVGRTNFIEVAVPDEIQAVPPVPPWHAALAGQRQRPVY